MSRLLRLALLGIPLLFACDAGDPLVTTTEGGTYTVAIETNVWATGWEEIHFTVSDASGLVTGGLEWEADVLMPAMGHGSFEEITLSEMGDHYVMEVNFPMPGEWEVHGSFGGEHFHLEGEVVGE